MRQLFLLLLLTLSSWGLFAQNSTFFVDFGPNDVTNGNETTSPDANGNYWNNIIDVAVTGTQIPLVDISNGNSTAYLQVTDDFASNGILNGGLLAPSASLLGDLAIATATQDYFFTTTTGGFTIGGLNAGEGYVFSLFGTRQSGSNRVSEYSLTGSNSYTGTLQTSGSGIGDGGYDGNNNTILVSDTIIADASGEIAFSLGVNTGGFAYLGMMQMEAVGSTAPPPPPAEPEVFRSFLVDLGPNDVANGNITNSPDANGNHWNNLINTSSNSLVIDLVTKANENSDLSLGVISNLLSNGIQNGGLLAPEDSLLGDFAVATATQDYFFTVDNGTLELTGLDPNKGYIFHLFGSRNTSSIRSTEYTLTGANQYVDTLQSSGPDLGGIGYNGNNSTILSTPPVRPDSDGSISLRIEVVEGGFAYLNTLQIDEVDATQRFWVDFGPNDVTNGNITVGPDVNGNFWNNIIDPLSAADSVMLVDNRNQSSGAYLDVQVDFGANGIINGGLLAPEDSLLGDFAIATATQDYFFTTGSADVEIGGLDTANGYVFSFFGTRQTTSNRVTDFTVSGENSFTSMLQTSGDAIGAGGYNGNNNTVLVSDTVYPDLNGKIVISVAVNQGGFAYIGAMNMQVILPKPPEVPVCASRDSLRIAVMGSSVADGFGATNSEGYAFQYTELLQDRFNAGEGADWSVDNISIGGNNTISLLNRFETDLLPLCGSYVIYGLSLGNEGIRQNGQDAFNQFRDNMLLLIDEARENGIEPVVVNCYARADFDATDYDFTREMNLLIHQWDVASINSLGAVDNGAGQWAQGYQADPFHPNTAGHTEMFYTMVPSLFDAMDAGKPQPDLLSGTFLKVDKTASDYQLEFTPDAIVHPFTTSFDIRTNGTGVVAGYIGDDGDAAGLIIEENGALSYTSAVSEGIVGTTVVNDTNWHKVTLTHYYAWGKTLLYVDGVLQGEVDEQLETETFFLSEKDAPTAEYREWYFYRAGMAADEVSAMVNGDLLKSSLELYAPLDGQNVAGTDSLENRAQSTNTIELVPARDLIITAIEMPLENIRFQLYPNPAQESATVQFSLDAPADVKVRVLDMMGREQIMLTEGRLASGSHTLELSMKDMPAQMYVCVLEVNGSLQTLKLKVID